MAMTVEDENKHDEFLFEVRKEIDATAAQLGRQLTMSERIAIEQKHRKMKGAAGG